MPNTRRHDVIWFHSRSDPEPGARHWKKYDPLRDHLAGYTAGDQLLLSFAEIEELVGPLPRGARRLHQWWANERTVQARAWQAADWRVLLADTISGQVLFQRLWPHPDDPTSASKPQGEESATHSYIDDVHLPLLSVLIVLSLILGAIGFALRPGTDKPPVVPNADLTLYIAGASSTDPTRLIVERLGPDPGSDPEPVFRQLPGRSAAGDSGILTASRNAADQHRSLRLALGSRPG